jgi:hypothetical protein
MIIGETGIVVIVPMTVISENLYNLAFIASGIPAMLKRDIHRLPAFVGPPEEAMFLVGCRIGYRRPDSSLVLRWHGNINGLGQIGRRYLARLSEK